MTACRVAVLLVAVSAGVSTAASAAPGEGGPPNFLVILADDLGIDHVGVYAAHPDPGRTPVIDRLAREGVRFANAWANPYCSSSRAAILTGRYSMRTGIGSTTSALSSTQLSLSELTLPEALPDGYRSAVVGKWHLAPDTPLGRLHPMLSGFEHHHGSLGNLPNADGAAAYFDWDKNVDGTLVHSTTYATTDTVNEALGFIDEWSSAPQPAPWLLWLGFNAPHKPYHVPPAHLHGYELSEPLDAPLAMQALTEAMDTEIGRLLAGISPEVRARTYVIFLGDNGTLGAALTPPSIPAHGKGTVFNAGVHVPLIVTGPGVLPGGVSEALVNVSDVYATVLELAGRLSSAEDSVSLVPALHAPGAASIRAWIYAESFSPDHSTSFVTREQAVRDARFKLRRKKGADQVVKHGLYDVLTDPHETHNLLVGAPLAASAQAAFDALTAVLDTQLDPAQGVPWRPLGFGLGGRLGLAILSGSGALVAGHDVTLELASGLPDAPGWLVAGSSAGLSAFKGGTLVPSPELILTFDVGAGGTAQRTFRWPAALPAGATLYLQVWQLDPGGVAGYSASTALAATASLP